MNVTGPRQGRLLRAIGSQTATLLVWLLCLPILGTSCVFASDAVVGINLTHPLGASAEDQTSVLRQMKADGVSIIRIGFFAPDLEKGCAFIKLSQANGIKVLLTVHSVYPANAPIRPYQPDKFPGMWKGPPLSAADPDLSGRFFQQLLDKLDADHIVLAGLELDNEINHPGFNAEFPLPGEGKNFTFEDLNNDPEGKQIAKGYLQYLKVLSALKQARDRSKVNQRTPLISAGLSDTGLEGPWNKKFDAAGIGATLQFLKANGLDRLVDAYGIHTYPAANAPGDKAAAIHRMRDMQNQDLSQCQAAGSSSGKPCWITEWGFTNPAKTCPPDERARTMLVQEMMTDFRQLAAQHKVTGLFYYTWTGDTVWDVYRCGAFTSTGKSAIQPF